METENYVYKKEVDWSVLMEGFTLPIENQVVFLQNFTKRRIQDYTFLYGRKDI